MSDKTESQLPTDGGSTPRPCSAGSMLNAYHAYIERFPWKRDELTYEKWILSSAIEAVAYRQGWADRYGNLNTPKVDSPVDVRQASAYMEKVAVGFDGYAGGHAEKGHQNLAAFNAGVAAGWRSASVVLESLFTKQNDPVEQPGPSPTPDSTDK